MRRELLHLFLCLFWLLCNFNTAAQEEYSFSDFNYPEESVTWGAQSRSSYFIPVNADQLLPGNSLKLEFKTSEVLDPTESFVTVLINDIPLSTKSTGNNGAVLSFSLPFTAKDISSGFLKIDVINDFAISDDICETYNEDAFWIRRLATSRLSLNYKKPKKVQSRYISDFIPKTKSILIPNSPSTELIQYATYIQFYFREKLEIDLEVKTFKDSLNKSMDQGILLATQNELPSFLPKILPSQTKDDGWVQLYSSKIDSISRDSLSTIQTLVVTGANIEGFEKAAQSLLDIDMLKSAYTTSYKVERGKDLFPSHSPQDRKLSLKKLGVQEEKTEGIGKLIKEITIPRAVFGFSPSLLELQLVLVHRPLKDSENAYLNVYFDNVLKHSQKLDETGNLSKLFAFNNLQLNRTSTLKIEYYYVPAGGLCVENPTSFYAQLDLNQSFIRASGIQENNNLTFLNFPENFIDKKSTIYLDLPFQKEQISSFSQFISALNPTSRTNDYYYPKILPLDSLQTHPEDRNLIIISSKQESLDRLNETNPYLDLSDGKYSFNKENFTKYFKLDYTDKIGVNQLFKTNSSNGMHLYVPDGKSEVLNELLEGIYNSQISNTGDVILASDKSSYFFNLTDSVNRTSNTEIQSDFDLFWKKYRIFVIFGFLILMIVLLIYIFQKSQESKKNIVDE